MPSIIKLSICPKKKLSDCEYLLRTKQSVVGLQEAEARSHILVVKIAFLNLGEVSKEFSLLIAENVSQIVTQVDGSNIGQFHWVSWSSFIMTMHILMYISTVCLGFIHISSKGRCHRPKPKWLHCCHNFYLPRSTSSALLKLIKKNVVCKMNIDTNLKIKLQNH